MNMRSIGFPRFHLGLGFGRIWLQRLLPAMILTSAYATPDRIVKIEEKLLGSNEDSYIVLRTESDNLGSYYSGRTKQYLDEYSKKVEDKYFDSAIGKLVGSTLLLDVSTSVDPDAVTLEERTPKSQVHSKDSSLTLAELLLKFSTFSSKWGDESFNRLTLHQKAGIHCGIASVIDGNIMTQEVFGNRYPEQDWVLDEVTQDMNCIFLKVAKRTPDEINETRIVCIPPRRSQKVLSHLSIAPFYLLAGPSYASLEEARKQAQLLKKKVSEANGYFQPEIWSLIDGTLNQVYVIADQNTKEHIKGGSFERLQNMLGVSITPRDSNDFIERFAVE
ncbi:MAG: hypothetical protein OJI67_24705 [Prosthecobacter sp.]|nr:hypothetical protein [Prosthecobacter sp.]